MKVNFIVFLLDQSPLMSRDDSQKAIEYIYSCIMDVLDQCAYGTDAFKNSVYITIIGYGGIGVASIIKEGWIREWGESIMDVCSSKRTFLPVIMGNSCPMDVAFAIAKKKLDDWFNYWEYNKRVKIDNLRVINITKGIPDSVYEAKNSAMEIMNMSTPLNVGNVLLFNFQISDDSAEIKYPRNRSELKGKLNREFLFDISSELTSEMIYYAKAMKFEIIQNGSRGFVLNNIHAKIFIKYLCYDN